MWDSGKSVWLSVVCTKVVMVLVVVFGASLPFFVRTTAFAEMFSMNRIEIISALVILYACCVIALYALWQLNRLLSNIRSEKVFIEDNVSILRAISWCCFLAGLVLVCGSFVSMIFLLLAIMAGFIGLILRVVKNVFEAAVLLKTENDYTI